MGGIETSNIPGHLWENLLEWLVDHGIDTTALLVETKATLGAGMGLFSTGIIPPLTPLFTIPSGALINVNTLGPLYPGITHLTGIQLVSLHLARYRPTEGESLDPLFGPYISIMPQDFHGHPLWLLVHGSIQDQMTLLDNLPPCIKTSLDAIRLRFQGDWEVVQSLIPDSESKIGKIPLTEANFLWGWLNVNTRCIYHRLKTSRSDPDNFTLCPILDFANHSTSLPCINLATKANQTGHLSSTNHNNDITVLSPVNTTTNQQELYLTYGNHSNHKLFVEYGFINAQDLKGSTADEVTIDDLMNELVSPFCKAILEEEGYLGDWLIYSAPVPAHPSFRTIAALRLHAAGPTSRNSPEIQLWRQTIMGVEESISLENEDAWRRTLKLLCDRIIERSKRGSATIVSDASDPGWLGEIKRDVLMLWEEEARVATAVSHSLLLGVEF